MMSNLGMLGRVTISSLGDIIQPYQNSISWTAALKGLADEVKDMPLEEGEIKTIIQLDIDNSDIFISICALKVNENEELVINRVLDSFTADKLAG